VACKHEDKNAYRVLVGKHERTRPRGRPRHLWEDNIEWIWKKWDRRLWIGLLWPRVGRSGNTLLNAVVNIRLS
jgi:hypothetical protein